MPNKEALNKILEEIKGSEVSLVAVSKTKPIRDLQIIYDAGQRVFGENKVQELREKQPVLPKDIQWHMIGHLQSNKVKYIASYISMIHAVDSIKLLSTIDKEAKKHNRVIKCLLQFHIAQETSKFGLDLSQAKELLLSKEFKTLENVELAGVMGMATFTDDQEQVRQEFRTLKEIFDTLKQDHFASKDSFKEISMGMSGDYTIAIEEGSTLIRVGSTIFGTRG